MTANMRDIYERKYRKKHPYWSDHDNKDTINVQMSTEI